LLLGIVGALIAYLRKEKAKGTKKEKEKKLRLATKRTKIPTSVP
jgi:hypothetical protein